MSHKRPPKTEGFTWLEYSLMAFNGSGYRDDRSPESFLDSYIDYSDWKKRPDAVKLAKTYYKAILPLAEHLVTTSNGASTTPSPKNWSKWQSFRTTSTLKLL